jgi:hypothetical protein
VTQRGFKGSDARTHPSLTLAVVAPLVPSRRNKVLVARSITSNRHPLACTSDSCKNTAQELSHRHGVRDRALVRARACVCCVRVLVVKSAVRAVPEVSLLDWFETLQLPSTAAAVLCWAT